MKEKGLPEYEDKQRLIRKWCLLFLYIIIQTVTTLVIWFFLGVWFLSFYPIDSTVVKTILLIIWCAVYAIPFCYLKMVCIIRNVKYCYVYCNGTRCQGTLLKMEKEGKAGGNERIVLSYCYEDHGRFVNAVHRVNCVDIDLSILGIQNVYGKYVIPDPTIIPVVVYRGRSIVVHNNCGLYDLAHYSGWLRPYHYF